MKSPLRLGILGCGRIGIRHAQHASKKMTLVACADSVGEKSQSLAAEYQCNSYDSLTSMLENEALDVVAVCTPNGLHASHAIECLESKIHVLCEKPMGLSTSDVGRMIIASERNNRRLIAVKQNRFNPPVVFVKNLLDEGKLGEIYSCQLSCFWNRNNEYYENSWKGTQDLDGGTLFTQFSHFLDLLIWLVGDITEVEGYSTNAKHKNVIDFEDCGVIAAKFSSGALGTINYSVNSYAQNMEGSLTILGSKGTVKIGGQYLNELDYCKLSEDVDIDLPEGNGPNAYGRYSGSMSNHGEVYDNLVEVLTDNGAVSTSAYEGLLTTSLIEKIYNVIRK